MSEQSVNLSIKRRPWYAWVVWAAWFLALVLIAQNALASSQEMESQAAMIFWISFAVLFIAGIVVWFVRREA